MNILFTICGRKGSKGFKNKNLKKMNGIPLVYYTLSVIKLYQQKHPEDFATIAVNTDSSELFEIIRRQTAILDIHEIERAESLAGDQVAKVDVIKDTYLKCKDQFDVVVDLDITSPMRTVNDIEKAIMTLKENGEYDLVVSVVPARRSPYFNMVEERRGYYQKVCPSQCTTRQESPAVYELNASIYAYAPSFLEKDIKHTILEYNCGIVEMSDYLILDIDSERDFLLMSMLMEYFQKENEELKRVITLAKEL